MAILSNGELKKRLKEKPPLVECPDPKKPIDVNLFVQPASVDLRLASDFLKYKDNIYFIDTQRHQEYYVKRFDIKEDEPLILLPNEFINGHTLEILNLDDKTCARVECRSSLARFGLMTHMATYMNPGYRGTVPLQLKNISNKPIIIRPYIRICTVIFEELTSPSLIPYNKRKDAKYFDEMDSKPSKLPLDPDLYEKTISKEEVERILVKTDKANLILKNARFSDFFRDILYEIISEADYLAKIKKKKNLDLEDINKAAENISKIFEYILLNS
ncbi:MAG: dCTP deaminase [Promethearchaeota archaeon]